MSGQKDDVEAHGAEKGTVGTSTVQNLKDEGTDDDEDEDDIEEIQLRPASPSQTSLVTEEPDAGEITITDAQGAMREPLAPVLCLPSDCAIRVFLFLNIETAVACTCTAKEW